MTEEPGTAEVLRRMASREGVPGGIPAMTPLRAMRLAVKKAGQSVTAAGMRLTGLEERRVSLAEFGPMLDDKGALFRLSAGPEAIGLMAVDAAIVHAIAAVRTTGAVPKDGLPERAATRIDTVVVMPILNAILAGFISALEGLEAERVITGYKIGAFTADRASTLLDLEDMPYRLFAGEISVGDGAGTGKLRYLVPADPPRLKVAPDLSRNSMEWQRKLRSSVMKSEAVLEARLAPMQMGLATLRMMKIGMELPLTADALSTIQLISLEGKTIASCKLGQLSGNRAVRIGEVKR
ncbi:MAG: FliM/FliN family flagellar motor switch protein [Deltaproteobacteria bacterium]